MYAVIRKCSADAVNADIHFPCAHEISPKASTVASIVDLREHHIPRGSYYIFSETFSVRKKFYLMIKHSSEARSIFTFPVIIWQ